MRLEARAFLAVVPLLTSACDPGAGGLQTGASTSAASSAATSGSGGGGAGGAAPGGGGAGGQVPYCSLHTTDTFCADFDEGLPYVSGFSGEVANGGTLAIDAEAFSPPGSLLAATLGSDTSPQNAFVFKTFLGTAAFVRCSCDLRVTSDPKTAGSGKVFALRVGGNGVALRVDPNAVVLEEVSAQPASHPVVTTFADGSWHRVAVELELGKSPAHAFVRLGPPGGEAETIVGDADLDASWVPGEAAVDLGVYFADLGTPWKVHYDDLYCDVVAPL